MVGNKFWQFRGKKRLTFTKEHIEWPLKKWRNILRTDESIIMIWVCFSYQDVFPIHWICENPWRNNATICLLWNISRLGLSTRQWPQTHQQEGKKWFADNSINTMEWQARSPDLNPIKKLRADINKGVHTIKPISNETN